jgi:hypothetical protein
MSIELVPFVFDGLPVERPEKIAEPETTPQDATAPFQLYTEPRGWNGIG